jgi:2-polyprenyl-6-methoxyphenol hydroxylase-like FAD-dependent oxidoreductase
MVSPDMLPDTVPVIVIGAGPVGLSVAIELRIHGIDVLVVERDFEIVDGHPKGRGNDLRTLEAYHRWGVSEELHRLSWQTRNPDQKLIITESIVDQPLGAYPLRYGRHVEESRKYAAEPSLSVPQPILMRVLQARAIELGARILRGWEATAIQQQAKNREYNREPPIATDLKCLKTGAIHRVQSDYVVGCDGPNSLVRQIAGISRNGDGPTARAYSYVVRTKTHKIGDLLKSPAHDSLAFLMVLNSKACTIISIPDEESWGFSFLVKDDAPIPTERQIIQAGRDVLGIDDTHLEVLSSSSYRVFTRVADSYSKGRLFLAGDSAHLCPPTGGHNMNTGIGDAVNLGWKLAAVLNGWGGEKLLSSYDIERRPVGTSVSNCAMDNSYSMANIGDIFAKLPPLEKDASQKVRFARGKIAYEATFQQWNSLGITLGQRYDKSPLIVKDDWEAPPYSTTAYWHYSSPGHRAPHLWLADGTPLIDHFGKGFTLLDVEASEVEVARFLEAADRVGLPFTHLALPANVARSKYLATITIIRPDQYISWQGDKSENYGALVDKIRGGSQGVKRLNAQL